MRAIPRLSGWLVQRTALNQAAPLQYLPGSGNSDISPQFDNPVLFGFSVTFFHGRKSIIDFLAGDVNADNADFLYGE